MTSMEIATEHVGDVVVVKIGGKFYSSAAVAAEESFAGALSDRASAVAAVE
jgi:hypothetical protein